MLGYLFPTLVLVRTFHVITLHTSSIILLAALTGLEPATPAVTGRCSNQLSYKTMNLLLPGCNSQGLTRTGSRCSPNRTRTYNRRINSAVLCRLSYGGIGAGV